MPQDAYTLRKISNELNSLLKGGKVSKIIQPLKDELALIFYKEQNYKLIISASATLCRASVEKNEKENPLQAYNFCMLLRKHLTNARLDGVEQVDFERILRFTFTVKNDFAEEKKKFLYAEIMGKYSNVILTDEQDSILGSMKSTSLDESNLRPLIVGMRYVLPPPQGKILPSDEKLIDVIEKNAGKNLSDVIFENVVGVARSTAAHFSLAAEGSAEEIFKKLNRFLFEEEVDPSFDNADFYPYRKTGSEECVSLLEAQAAFYEGREKRKRFEEKFNRLSEIVRSHEKKLNKRREIIEKKEQDAEDREKYKIYGELLTANQYRLKAGAAFAEVENFYSEDGELISIPLDRLCSINQNAQKYFKKYAKLKRTLEAIKPQKEEVLKELDYFESLKNQLEIASDLGFLEEIEKEFISSGLIKRSDKKKKKEEQRFLTYAFGGARILVGRSNLQNDKLLELTRGEYVWLHTKTYHSAHVVIESDNPSEEVIKFAAEITAYYSKGRGGNKIEVDYTKKRNVKKVKGAGPGFVTYTDYKTIVVDPYFHAEFIKNG